jgi:hypothetical protein
VRIASNRRDSSLIPFSFSLAFAPSQKRISVYALQPDSQVKTGKTLAFKPKSRSITGMEKAEIKSIGNYLKTIEEGI